MRGLLEDPLPPDPVEAPRNAFRSLGLGPSVWTQTQRGAALSVDQHAALNSRQQLSAYFDDLSPL